MVSQMLDYPITQPPSGSTNVQGVMTGGMVQMPLFCYHIEYHQMGYCGMTDQLDRPSLPSWLWNCYRIVYCFSKLKPSHGDDTSNLFGCRGTNGFTDSGKRLEALTHVLHGRGLQISRKRSYSRPETHQGDKPRLKCVFQANWIDKHQSGPGKPMAMA